MLNRIKVFLLLQTCFFVSCAQKVKLEQGNIVEIKYSATANPSLGYTYCERKGYETLAILDTLNQEIYFYNIADSKKIDSIRLNNIERKFGIKKIQFFTVGENGNAYIIFVSIR